MFHYSSQRLFGTRRTPPTATGTALPFGAAVRAQQLSADSISAENAVQQSMAPFAAAVMAAAVLCSFASKVRLATPVRLGSPERRRHGVVQAGGLEPSA